MDQSQNSKHWQTTHTSINELSLVPMHCHFKKFYTAGQSQPIM